MTWVCGLRLWVWLALMVALTWVAFGFGYVRGVRHEGRRLRRRLMLAGSHFANNDD